MLLRPDHRRRAERGGPADGGGIVLRVAARRWGSLAPALRGPLAQTRWISAAGADGLCRDDWRLQCIVADAILRASPGIGQAVAVLFLAPVLVAGAIAEEKQRKTLHYLLASRLSSLEIVVGKLAARLILVASRPARRAGPGDTSASSAGSSRSISLLIYGVTLTTVALRGVDGDPRLDARPPGPRGAPASRSSSALAWFVGPVLLQNRLTGLREPWPTPTIAGSSR